MPPRIAVLAIVLLLLSASSPFEFQQEIEISTCTQRGYNPGEPTFEECRLQVRAEMAQAEYAAASETQMQDAYHAQIAELEGAECADLGYVPGSQAFEDCRWEMHRNGMRQHYYYTNSDFVYPSRHEGKHCDPHHRYASARPPSKHDHYINEYGQDCKKTHRGWILCK